MQILGRFINLSRSHERRANMQSHLNALGLSAVYERFEAVEGAQAPERFESQLGTGHLGCWLSHQRLWEEAAGLGEGQAMHILEDDARLHPHCHRVVGEIAANHQDWDLLFTDVFWHPPPTPLQWAKLCSAIAQYRAHQTVSVQTLKGWRTTGSSSYLVSPRGAQALLKHLNQRWREGTTVDVCIDQLIQEEQLKAWVVMPFLSTLSTDHAVSTTGEEGPAVDAISAFRMACYVDADPSALLTGHAGASLAEQDAPFLTLYLRMLRGVLRGFDPFSVASPQVPGASPGA